MDKLFSTDINNVLMEYMTTKEMFDLAKYIGNMKLSNTLINKNIVNNINLRLSLVFGDKLDIFKKFLEDTKSFISGSFIVQCILDETYNGSDIDVYINKSKSKDLLAYYEANNICWFENANESFNYDMSFYSNVSFDVNHYYINKYRIQFILAEDPIAKLNLFDINICKNMYSIENGIGRISTNILDQLLEKKSDMNYVVKDYDNTMMDGRPNNTNFLLYISRYNKYTSRGFVLNKVIPENIMIKYTSNPKVFNVEFVSVNKKVLTVKYDGGYLPNRRGTKVFLMESENIYTIQNHVPGRYYEHCMCMCNSSLSNCECGCGCGSYILYCRKEHKCVYHFMDIKHIHCDGSTTVIVNNWIKN